MLKLRPHEEENEHSSSKVINVQRHAGFALCNAEHLIYPWKHTVIVAARYGRGIS